MTSDDEIVINLPKSGPVCLGVASLAAGLGAFDHLVTRALAWKSSAAGGNGWVAWTILTISLCTLASAVWQLLRPSTVFRANRHGVWLSGGFANQTVVEVSWKQVSEVKFGEAFGPDWQPGQKLAKTVELVLDRSVELPSIGSAYAKPVSRHAYAIHCAILPDPAKVEAQLSNWQRRAHESTDRRT